VPWRGFVPDEMTVAARSGIHAHVLSARAHPASPCH